MKKKKKKSNAVTSMSLNLNKKKQLNHDLHIVFNLVYYASKKICHFYRLFVLIKCIIINNNFVTLRYRGTCLYEIKMTTKFVLYCGTIATAIL